MTPDNMTLVGSVVLSIIYMVFVFIVLLVISYLVDITAFILKRKQRKSKEDSSSSDLKVSEFSISDASDMKMNPKNRRAICSDSKYMRAMMSSWSSAVFIVNLRGFQDGKLPGWKSRSGARYKEKGLIVCPQLRRFVSSLMEMNILLK